MSTLAPPRTGKRGRPRLKGDRLAGLAALAATAPCTSTSVHRYGATLDVQTAVIACLWYGVFGPQRVQVVLVRDRAATGYDVALVSTDLAATPAQVERYAARWSIEVAIADAKQTTGVGQAQPSVNDMHAKLRRVLITTQLRRTDPQPATPEEINIFRLAWADAAA